MAVNVQIYGNVSGRQQSVTVDFVGDVLVANDDPFANDIEYYFKFTTAARSTDGSSLGTKISRSLDDLVLNSVKQSAVNTANAYSDVNSMVVDYLYDYINGHTDDQYSSGVTEQLPMNF